MNYERPTGEHPGFISGSCMEPEFHSGEKVKTSWEFFDALKIPLYIGKYVVLTVIVGGKVLLFSAKIAGEVIVGPIRLVKLVTNNPKSHGTVRHVATNNIEDIGIISRYGE